MTKDVKTTNKNINSQPEIDKKVNAMATLTPIIKSESEKIDETGRNTVIGKVLSFVEGGGGVKAEAWGCRRRSQVFIHWWGFQVHINECVIQDLYLAGGSLILILALLALTACPILCGAIAAVVGWKLGFISWLNFQCGGDGVMLNQAKNGTTWFWAVC